MGRGNMAGPCHQPVSELLALDNWQWKSMLNDGGFSTCASPHSRGLNGTWRPPEGGFLGSSRGRHNAGRVQMSRGTACCKIHQKYPPGGHRVPEITKSDFKSEIKTYSIPYTHQGVSGGSRKYFWSAPLRTQGTTQPAWNCCFDCIYCVLHRASGRTEHTAKVGDCRCFWSILLVQSH